MTSLFAHKPRPIRSAPNPYDKSSVVSIFPQKIVERKWTLEPGIFTIEAGSRDNPSVLVVGSSSWWKALHEEKSVLEIPTGSALIAESVVRDFCNSVDLYNEAMGPGLFFVPGRSLTSKDIAKEFQKELYHAEARQKNWYIQLITVADMLWAKSGGNPRVVNDLAKLAARELQIKDKPWMSLETQSTLINCTACGSLRNGNYPVCSTCNHIIDMEKYKEMNLQKAV